MKKNPNDDSADSSYDGEQSSVLQSDEVSNEKSVELEAKVESLIDEVDFLRAKIENDDS